MSLPPIDELIDDLTEMKERYVEQRLAYYKDRVDNRRRAARSTSVIVIFISLLLIPLATNFLPDNALGVSTKLLISGASLLIGLVSGLQELFKWDAVWHQYSTRIVEIESAVIRWELEIVRLKQRSDDSAARKELIDATKVLLLSVDQAVLSEMEEFFSRVKEQEKKA